MATSNGSGPLESSLPQLAPHETKLVELASSGSTRGLSLSEKESQILELYDRIHEQQLEEALLRQVDPIEVEDTENVQEQLEKAERELLEARATYSLQRKAIEAVLMTEPTVQSVHAATKTPIERSLSALVSQRDMLSFIYENLARSHSACLESLNNAEIENMKINDENQKLVRKLFEYTEPDEKTGKNLITDPNLKEKVEEVEEENKRKKADWVTMKRIVSAIIVASGVDWASDEILRELVLDESVDDV